MKIISISTDRKIFEEGSAVKQRIVDYGSLFERLDIIVFAKRKSEISSKIQIAQNVFVYPTNSKNKLLYIFDAIKIARKLIGNSQDLVISAQDPFETGLVGLFLKIIYKLPLQVQLHTDFANKYFILHSPLNFTRFPLGLFVLSFADSVRVVSERIARSIHSLSHNISVLPIWVEKSPQILVSAKKQTNKINFLTVCRLEKEKDLETAIRAFKKIIETGVLAIFTIVGDGSERERLQTLVNSLQLKNQVKFEGWKNDLESYYTDAHVYISTSLYEGYGMSIVEAASYGLPLILTDTGIALDYFQNEISALICQQKSVLELYRAMEKLALNRNLRIEMGNKAKQAVLERQISNEEYLNKFKSSINEALTFSKLKLGIFKRNILLRYLVAGFSGAGTQIGLLYLLTDVLNIWYLYSSIISFAVAIIVSFLLQKIWTFGDKKVTKAHMQFMKYLVVAVCGIFINTGLMYFFVDLLQIWYILAQIFAGGVIAIFNFLMYKFFVFRV